MTAPNLNQERLSLDEARMLAVIAQRLDRRPSPLRLRERSKQRILELVRHLGSIQIDTISVISRSHETVLWSRLGKYDPALFEEIYYPDGKLFEYWAHAAAFIPIETLPHYRRGMEWYRGKFEAPESWAAQEQELVERVLAKIRERGPLASRDFERPEGPRPEPWEWYGGKPDRQALDHLWSRGDLMVQRRQGFQRVYDLTERVAPHIVTHPPTTLEEDQRHFATASLRAMGIAVAPWVADYFRFGSKRHLSLAEVPKVMASLASEGQVIPVEIEGIKEQAWLDPAMIAPLTDLRAGRGRPTLTTLLSPFDNLIWYRPRTSALFGFEYRLECYVPAPKRLYGYYNMPILHRGRLVGRVDPSYDRRARVLTIKMAHLEPAVRPTASLVSAVAGALTDLANFLGGETVVVQRSNPEPFATMLNERLGTTVPLAPVGNVPPEPEIDIAVAEAAS